MRRGDCVRVPKIWARRATAASERWDLMAKSELAGDDDKCGKSRVTCVGVGLNYVVAENVGCRQEGGRRSAGGEEIHTAH